MWGATCSRFAAAKISRFNPRSHVGSDKLRDRQRQRPKQFQSTLPCGERLLAPFRGTGQRYVSIHAPTWGATLQADDLCTSFLFQSTLPRGERPLLLTRCAWQNRFNPRSHVGSDKLRDRQRQRPKQFQSTLPRGERHLLLCIRPGELSVSIHAPTWGATFDAPTVGRFSSFNPRSHVGSDTSVVIITKSPLCFNPRSHVGSDSYRSASFIPISRFQSTLPRGERHKDAAKIAKATVSIHAPTWGATHPRLQVRCSREFQSTLPRGERPGRIPGRAGTYRFNPRSHVGSDPTGTERATQNTLFQSTLPRGERPIPSFGSRPLRVSIHAPTWGATMTG